MKNQRASVAAKQVTPVGAHLAKVVVILETNQFENTACFGGAGRRGVNLDSTSSGFRKTALRHVILLYLHMLLVRSL